MYKWLSGLLSGTSSTLHCSGANSHRFIMFCHNWHSPQTSALWLGRLSGDLGLHQRPASLAPSPADQSLQAWPDQNSRGLENRNTNRKFSFLQSGMFPGLIPWQRVVWQAVLLHICAASQEMPYWGNMQGCICVHKHTIHAAPAASVPTMTDFSTAGNSSEWLTRRSFHWNVFN